MSIDTHGGITIEPETFLGFSVGILGTSGYGKSNSKTVLAEEALELGLPLLMVDIEGEDYSIRTHDPRVKVVGRPSECQPDIVLNRQNVEEVAEAAYMGADPVILDLSGYDAEFQKEILYAYLRKVWELALLYKIPLVIMIDECHEFVPQTGKSDLKNLIITIAKRGRKRGLSLVLASQRPAEVSKGVLSQVKIYLLHKVTSDADLKAYTGIVPKTRSWVETTVFKLSLGKVILIKDDPKNGSVLTTIQVRLQKSPLVSSTPTLANIPNWQGKTLNDFVGNAASKYD